MITFVQMVRLAKRLKKEKVNMDIVNFGEDVSFIYSPLPFLPHVISYVTGFFHNAVNRWIAPILV